MTIQSGGKTVFVILGRFFMDIRENVIIDDLGNEQEVAVCPGCGTEYYEGQEESSSGDLYEFECSVCQTKFSAELHNVTCLNCTRSVSEQVAIEDEDGTFCSENCRSIYLDENPPDENPLEHIPTEPFSDCTYCNKNGICKNDDNPYNFDEECPGDCSYYYRK